MKKILNNTTTYWSVENIFLFKMGFFETMIISKDIFIMDWNISINQETIRLKHFRTPFFVRD